MDELTLPNIRKIFIPDPGHVLYDADLKGADAQVVAWEADDEDLKAAFRAGLDVHAKNAGDMMGAEFTKLSEDDPKRKKLRNKSKRSVHAANYLVSSRTLAANAGMLVVEAERFITRWFQIHPKIKDWHRRLERDIALTRKVRNAFGYEKTFFDRPEDCMTQAVAWIPQSTVALVTVYGAANVRRTIPETRDIFNLQVHDSLIFQLQRSRLHLLPLIGERLHVPVPYDDVLTIPWELKSSSYSWGDARGTTFSNTAVPSW